MAKPTLPLARALALSAAATCLIAGSLGARGAAPKAPPTWDAAAAARYLDTRLEWWRHWPKAARDHDTQCISCHTALPHVLGEQALRPANAPRSAPENAMYDDVTKRVWLWRETEPFYTDQVQGIPKSSESRSVEAVLNALFLATRDQERGLFGTDTRTAFDHMWAIQSRNAANAGGFPWLNFHLEPWESPSATYWGATLAAIAVARAPASYRDDPAVAPHVEALRGYLRAGLPSATLYTSALILIADAAIHGVLDPAQRDAIVTALVSAQEPDGGWPLPSLAPWERVDKSVLPTEPDGDATAIAALALREAGTPAAAAPLARAKAWLIAHQDRKTGAIPAKSINKDRKPETDAYLFMTDHATGIAAMVLRPAS